MKLPIIRLTGVGLYSLSRLAVGDIKEIIVRWSGGGYFELDQNSHVIINGDGKAFTNNFSFLDQKYDPYYKEGVALVALLAGHGAKLQGAGEKQGDLPQPQPSSDKRQPPPVGAKEEIDFGHCPPNEKQLNSLAHVLAIMCLGLRLNVDSIKTLAEIVNLDEELRMMNCGKDGLEEHLSARSGAGDRLKERVGGGGVWLREKQGDLPQPQPSSDKRQPPPVGAKQATESRTSDKINLAAYPCEMGTGGDVIRARTQEVLDDMKKGLYRSINPALAKRNIAARADYELRIEN